MITVIPNEIFSNIFSFVVLTKDIPTLAVLFRVNNFFSEEISRLIKFYFEKNQVSFFNLWYYSSKVARLKYNVHCELYYHICLSSTVDIDYLLSGEKAWILCNNQVVNMYHESNRNITVDFYEIIDVYFYHRKFSKSITQFIYEDLSDYIPVMSMNNII